MNLDELEPEQEHVPHYERYAESLKDKAIADIEKIAGVEYTPPGWDYTRMEHGFPTGWVGEEKTVPAFVSAIVSADKKKPVLKYLALMVDRWTTQIKENRFSGGRVSPTVFVTDSEENSFWDEAGESSLEEEERDALIQLLEVERLHRSWLLDLHRLLLVEQKPKRVTDRATQVMEEVYSWYSILPDHVKGEVMIDPRFPKLENNGKNGHSNTSEKKGREGGKKRTDVAPLETLFRDGEKLAKLTQILQSRDFVDENRKWISDENASIIALCEVLCETKAYLTTTKRTPVGRSICKYFGLGEKPFDESMFRKLKNPEWLSEMHDILKRL
ncbi:hypothetical protein CLV24_104177 [Pontibacter ummariensis]|uniref:Uncharacterized protein n=1 Tax=Pontibacter ummariensis TaxID=1610492 RepID=A0A239DEF6_9BACT|nr:hypothetical protein [Pontibacter ummariensis]PRY14367.1 hypothetical protein CLV24_104177 [Pontibacter ummariensis]SNS30281.1 hypothetical protein SAMN06296052_104176 [Pontibacter ummariensis]